jgi:predicted ArsR family transcriptional regulator
MRPYCVASSIVKIDFFRNTAVMDAVRAISALDDPVRAAVYEYVAGHGGPVGRDAVAQALQLPRSTAAFHLDRLAASGLVTVSFRRPEGRGGPGAGRPAKLYALAEDEIAVSLPDRHYDLMGDLLASAIRVSAERDEPVLDALRSTAAEAGREAGRTSESFDDVLETTGFHPSPTPDGVVMMNCPFHRLAATHTDVVCAASHAFLCGAAETTGADPDEVLLEPGAGRCCVRVLRQHPANGQTLET